MVQNTADRANIDDDIANAAKLIGKSKPRRAVFAEIFRGKKTWKTVDEIAARTGLTRKSVLNEAKKFVDHHYVKQGKVDGVTAYSKDSTLNRYKTKILAAAGNREKQAKLPTRSRPHVSGGFTVQVRVKGATQKPRRITIDSVASFKLARNFAPDPSVKLSALREEDIKAAFKKIIGETHDFKDWGGEKNDLFTNKLRLASARKNSAFAFKGRATTGTLTPKKMGKNGDQVGRLMSSEADVFFVVYHGKVDESIHAQMQAFALGRSMAGRQVYHGVIDGDDLSRLYQAYRRHFPSPRR
jgi:hypothetical protein